MKRYKYIIVWPRRVKGQQQGLTSTRTFASPEAATKAGYWLARKQSGPEEFNIVTKEVTQEKTK